MQGWNLTTDYSLKHDYQKLACPSKSIQLRYNNDGGPAKVKVMSSTNGLPPPRGFPDDLNGYVYIKQKQH